MAKIVSYSVPEDDRNKHDEAIDTWKQKGLSVSKKTVEAIKSLHNEEQKEQSTLDKIVEKQKLEDEKNRKMSNYIMLVDELDRDMEKIADEFGREEVIRLYKDFSRLSLRFKKALDYIDDCEERGVRVRNR